MLLFRVRSAYKPPYKSVGFVSEASQKLRFCAQGYGFVSLTKASLLCARLRVCKPPKSFAFVRKGQCERSCARLAAPLTERSSAYKTVGFVRGFVSRTTFGKA